MSRRLGVRCEDVEQLVGDFREQVRLPGPHGGGDADGEVGVHVGPAEQPRHDVGLVAVGVDDGQTVQPAPGLDDVDAAPVGQLGHHQLGQASEGGGAVVGIREDPAHLDQEVHPGARSIGGAHGGGIIRPWTSRWSRTT